MDYGKILARSFEVTRQFRALWLFGFLLALLGGEGGGGSFNLGNFGGNGGGGHFDTEVPAQVIQMILVVALALVCFFLVWLLLSIVLRFVCRAAIIGQVQELEANGTAPTVRRGFSIGAANFWRLLGIALVVNIPLALFSMAVILVGLVPLVASLVPLIAAGRNPSPEVIVAGVSGAIGSIALLCCLGFFLWLIQLIIHPFYQFIVCTCIIRQRGVMDSIREGYRLVRENLQNVAVLYLLLIGIEIGFGLLMLIVALILIGIPVVLAIAVGVAANSATPAIVVGVVVGIPMLILLIFIGGLYQTFRYTTWTEGYLTITAPAAS